MKPRHFLLLSLGLNLALAAALFASWRKPTVPAVVPLTKASAAEAADATGNPLPAAVGAAAATNFPFHWRMVDSDDFRQFIANLRAIGCPERTIRDIIVADVDRLYETKGKSVPFTPPPWQNADRRRAEDRTRAAKLSALRAEKRALVKELIGYEWDNHANELWHQDFITGLLLGFLPEGKAPQLMAIVEKYTEMAQDVKDAANGIIIDEDRARLRKIYDDLVAEASQLLTPADREEVELRIQAGGFLAGNDIQWNGVSITGAELREFVRLSKAYKDTFQKEFLGLGDLSDAELARRKAAFEKQVEKLLGPARFADYQRAQNYSFREIFEFTQEHSLPVATAIKIYDARRTAEDQASKVKEDKSLSSQEQATALAVLKATTAGTVSSALGKTYSNYLNGPGQWLETLAAPPESKAPGKGP